MPAGHGVHRGVPVGLDQLAVPRTSGLVSRSGEWFACQPNRSFGPSRPWLTRSAARPRTPTIRPSLTAMSSPSPLECRIDAVCTHRSTSSWSARRPGACRPASATSRPRRTASRPPGLGDPVDARHEGPDVSQLSREANSCLPCSAPLQLSSWARRKNCSSSSSPASLASLQYCSRRRALLRQGAGEPDDVVVLVLGAGHPTGLLRAGHAVHSLRLSWTHVVPGREERIPAASADESRRRGS